MPHPSVRLSLVLATAGLVVACGEGGTLGSRSGSIVSDSLLSLTALNGVVQSNGNVSTTGSPAVGDVDATFPAVTIRGFYSFDLSSIPAGTVIRTANLKLRQFRVTGSPYANLGNVVLDHVTYGTALDPSDYGGGTLDSAFAVLSSGVALGTQTVNVFTKVKADLAANSPVVQFRIRFSGQDGDDDGVTDLAEFNGADQFPPPIIIITWEE